MRKLGFLMATIALASLVTVESKASPWQEDNPSQVYAFESNYTPVGEVILIVANEYQPDAEQVATVVPSGITKTILPYPVDVSGASRRILERVAYKTYTHITKDYRNQLTLLPYDYGSMSL